MKFVILACFFVFSSCQKDRIELSLSEVAFSESKLKSYSAEKLREISKDPALRFEWKRAMVKRFLEEKVEKVVTTVDRKASDAAMGQAESELTQPNGIEISGVVFFIPKRHLEKMSKEMKADVLAEKTADLENKMASLAKTTRQSLLSDPSDRGLERVIEATKKVLPEGIEMNLKREMKLLARYEVETPGWFFIPGVLDAHKDSDIDNVAPSIKIGSNIFVTILRKRTNAETLSVDLIRKRADEIGLAESRKAATNKIFATAIDGVGLELFPDVIQKDGTVE